MHGEIELESKLGVGTKTTFWISFPKGHYRRSGSFSSPDGLPDRLIADVSVSESHEDGTPPSTPGQSLLSSQRPHSRVSSLTNAAGVSAVQGSIPDNLMALTDSERRKIHVLVVEDK
jgi:hypothetical protein